MKMGMALYPMFAVTSGRILDMLEEKGFKTENIVDYTSAEEDGFFWKEREAYP
jgi:hypothetical protein